VSLYNLLHGENPIGAALLACLNLTMEDVGRYRDDLVGRSADYARDLQTWGRDLLQLRSQGCGSARVGCAGAESARLSSAAE